MGKHTPGPWTIEYYPWPCEFNGTGEPNPPAAFVGPADSDEAVALVFADPNKDLFDQESLEANARLVAAAPAMQKALDEIRYITSWARTPELVHIVCNVHKIAAGILAMLAEKKRWEK